MGDPTSLKAEKDADRGPNRAQNGHSSAGGAASTGPSALDRRSGTSCSSVRSHRVVRSQPSAPRRHHCQPEGAFGPHWQPLRGPCWPPVLANGGRSALLAGARSTRSWSSSQAEPSERCAEQCQRAAPVRSRFSRPGRFNALRGQKPTQLRLSAHPTASTARSLVAPTLALTLAASYPRPPP